MHYNEQYNQPYIFEGNLLYCTLHKGLGYSNHTLVTSVAFLLCAWHVKSKECLQFESV